MNVEIESNSLNISLNQQNQVEINKEGKISKPYSFSKPKVSESAASNRLTDENKTSILTDH